jgi:tRNA modification GTPase
MTTIIAPASALGGGVAVLRVSGGLCGVIWETLTDKKLPEPRLAQLVNLYHPTTKKQLDKALGLYFKAPHSFTGEDVIEFHVHGGPAIVRGVMEAIKTIDPTIRLAEGGEFSKRAYLNGKIDLTEAEAIADLVAAETELQADLARAQMGGGLRDLVEGWRADLVRILAHIEATIDFVDEEDVPPELFDQTTEKLAPLLEAMNAHLNEATLGERLREGFVITVIGAPNAGKSSLVNTLAKRDVAIVSKIAGTTRDALEIPMILGGYPVILIDTAGLRDTSDTIEEIGIARAREKAASADIVLALFDATQPPDVDTLQQCDARTVIVQTKGDLTDQRTPITISTITGENIDQLVQTISEKLAQLIVRPKDAPPLLTRARHREAVNEATVHLHRACRNADIALLAEDIRQATRAIGRLTGRVDVEDLLDVIFKDFCIGK